MLELFNKYFYILSEGTLSNQYTGFDLGCGSGRWAKVVAPKVKHLHCIDPAKLALEKAKKILVSQTNISFHSKSVKEHQLLAKFFEKIEPVLQKLSWIQEGIRYYEIHVFKARTLDLGRRSDEDRYIHLIAFIAHQYFKLQDTLINILLAAVRNTKNRSQKDYKE